MRRVLCVGAHVDDIELGCGGMLHKHCTRIADWDAHCVVMSHSIDEAAGVVCVESLGSLGCSHTVVKGLPVNCLWAERQAVWQAIWDVVESFDPDLVVTVAADLHQDHETVHNETMRACAGRSVLSYGILPSHPATFSGKYYEVLEEEDIAAKVHAVGLYAPCSASSGLNKVRYEDKAYMQPGVIWAQAKVAAISTGSPLAEVLSVERLVM